MTATFSTLLLASLLTMQAGEPAVPSPSSASPSIASAGERAAVAVAPTSPVERTLTSVISGEASAIVATRETATTEAVSNRAASTDRSRPIARQTSPTLESVIALAEQPPAPPVNAARSEKRSVVGATDAVAPEAVGPSAGDVPAGTALGARTHALPDAARALLRDTTRAEGGQANPSVPLSGGVLAILIIAFFAGIALLLSSRRTHLPRLVHVIDRVPIARGRELLLVQVGGDHLLLSSSAHGTIILRDNVRVRARDLPARELESRDINPRSRETSEQRESSQPFTSRFGGFIGALARLLASSPQAKSRSFGAILDESDVLQESTEDAEIRRKMMQRMASLGPDTISKVGAFN
jgi:hypothetical protein